MGMQEVLSEYIHASKYARFIPDLQRRETFKETALRVCRMHQAKFPDLTKSISDVFREMVLTKKVLPSMRSMQFAGNPIYERNERMYNCSFTLIDRPEVFSKILYLLLCGVGVGYSVQKQHVEKLPALKLIDESLICHHTVKDTIEGWADAISALINGFLNGYYVEFNYNQLRPMGSQLQSGGKAPGHLDLKYAIEKIRNLLYRVLINNKENKLRPIDCHDIICHMAKTVLAGGIRRSSLIALFSKDDTEMLTCKTPEFFNFNFLNSQRALCNNSVVLNPDICIKDDLAFIIGLNKKGIGEPGFIFLENEDWGINPCGEIGIDPTWLSDFAIDMNTKVENLPLDQYKQTGFGFCNLVEINAAACEDEADFYHACNAASFIATLQASYTRFPYIGEISEKIARRDALIGVSITGMMDAKFDIFSSHTLQTGAHYVQTQNKVTAKEIGINAAARCTCIKPAGTSSLELGGVSCGIHPHPARSYIKRITANPQEPIAQYFKNINPHMVIEKPNGDWSIEFPIITKGKISLDFNAISFLDIIYGVYKDWILSTHQNSKELTHNISCTVQVAENEWDAVLNSVWRNRHKIRCMTFLPEEAYKWIPFMPNEPIATNTNRWEKLIYCFKPVDYEFMQELEDNTLRGAACDGDKCDFEDRTFITGKGLRIFEGEPIVFEWEEDGIWWKALEQRNGYFIAQRKH